MFPCHGVGGMAGMVLTAVFAKEGGLLTTGHSQLLFTHLAALAIVSAYTFGGSWLIYKAIDLVTPLRVDEHHEQLGLDLSQHGENYGFFDAAIVKGSGTFTCVFVSMAATSIFQSAAVSSPLQQ